MQGESTFNIVIYPEDGGYVGEVLENHVSSFGDTEEEALAMTSEALKLWVESQMNFKVKKLSNMIQSIRDNTYITKIQYASSIYS